MKFTRTVLAATVAGALCFALIPSSTGFAGSGSGGGGGGGGGGGSEAVGTKLELAKAYLEIGDKDGARDILHEVAKEGSAAQKEEAKKLISSL